MAALPSTETLRRMVEETSEVGTLPHVMLHILDIIADETSSAQDLATAVATDASLTAKILKIVNSAFYGFYREIGLMSDAIVVLGFEEIKRISLAISVVGMFGARSNRDTERVAFWHHCFHTAAMADMLDREYLHGGQGAFTAGLLHDVGHVLLEQQFPDIHDALVTNQRETGRRRTAVEADLLGATHAEIGYWLAERWNLPPALTGAIRYHHTPAEAPADEQAIAALTHIADVLVHRLSDDPEADTPERELDPHATATLGADPARLSALQDELADRIAQGDTLVADLVGPA